MTIYALQEISEGMESLGLNYAFMEYQVEDDEEAPETYFVGEYQESPPMYEDGLQETSFIITGFSRGSWLALEEMKEKIESHFNSISGRKVIAEDGTAVAIFYSNSSVLRTGTEDWKKIQINLDIKEWKVK